MNKETEITFEEIQKKMSDTKYRADDDNVLSCKTAHQFRLADHFDGWPYWGTIGYDNAEQCHCFFISKFAPHKIFFGASTENDLQNSVIDNVDVRNLEPITKEDFDGRFTLISSRIQKEIGHEMLMGLRE